MTKAEMELAEQALRKKEIQQKYNQLAKDLKNET